MVRPLPALLVATLLVVPAPASLAPSRLEMRTGYSIEYLTAQPSPEAEETRRALTRETTQAMLQQFLEGKHPYRGMEAELDLTPPPEPTPSPAPAPAAPEPKAKTKAGKGKPAKAAKAAPAPEPTPPPAPAVKKKPARLHTLVLAFKEVDSAGLDALRPLGLEGVALRLHTPHELAPEAAQRLTASFLLAQAYGGPLARLAATTEPVSSSLLASLDRVTPSNFVIAWRLRDRIRAVAAGKEKPVAGDRAGKTEVTRATLVAKVWAAGFDDAAFGPEILEGLSRLGNAEMGGLLELMAQVCREARFHGLLLDASKVLSAREFELSLQALRDYQARAFDFAMPETLIDAVSRGQTTRVKRLLDKGADPRSRERNGEPAIILAVSADRPEIAKALAEAGADIGVTGSEGRNALELAIWKRRPALVEALLVKADLKARDRAAGERALLLAAREGDAASAKVLVAAGTAQDLRDENKTPLLVLAIRGAKTPELVAALPAAPIDAADKQGTTPLMAAAERGSRELVEAVLARGPNPLAKNDRGRTAAEIAEDLGHPELATLIKAAKKPL